MKLKSLVLLALAAVLTFAVPRPARALEVSFEFFHDSLSPHGEWLEVGDYGYCWRPSDVDDDWAPYADGYWSYTDAGWTWVSYEEFGGIVYHYGRWVSVEDEGWCWVPDYEWGPAWVSWRRSDDYVGWAPLPAEARWERNRGISVWADTSYDIAPTRYNFCRSRDFGAPVLRPVIVRRSENIVIIRNTVNVTNITYNTDAGWIFNGGLDYGYVNRVSHRPIPALKLVHNTNVTVVNNHIVNNNVRVTNFNSVQRGNQLSVVAPTVVRPAPAQVAALLQPKVKRVIAQNKVTKGWGGIPTEEREALRAKFKKEAAGRTPETTPAVAVSAADLKVVPEKADPTAKLPGDNRRSPVAGAGRGKKTPDESVTNAEGTPPTGASRPLTAAEMSKAAREKAAAEKAGKPVEPDAPENPLTAPSRPLTAAEKSKAAREKAAAQRAGKPVEPTASANPPAAVSRPITAAERSKAAREKAADRKPTAEQPIVNTPPTVQPGIVKPFNPAGNDGPPAEGVRKAPTAPPVNTANEKRKEAAEAAKNQASAKEAARQRGIAEKTQEAAAARQRALQQQQEMKKNQQEQAVSRKRTSDAVQMQQNQQAQALRERSAQAAEARQRSLQAQQAQAAAARKPAAVRAPSQPVARPQPAPVRVQPPKPVARPKPAPVQIQPPRPVAPRPAAPPPQARTLPRTAAPAVQPQKAPGKPGKRPLTPEEAAQQ